MKIRLIALAAALTLAQTAWAGDYTKFRQNLAQEAGDLAAGGRVALVFNTKSRETLKEHHDLIQVKKELSKELLKSFSVSDPVITAEVMRRNNLTAAEVKAQETKLNALSRHVGADKVLYLELEPQGDALTIRGELLDQQGSTLALQQMELLPAKTQAQPVKDELAARETRPQAAPGESPKGLFGSLNQPRDQQVVAQFGENFTASSFNEEHNESWVDLNPTAYIAPTPLYLQASIYLKNIADVDIPPKDFRLDWRMTELFQVSYQINTDAEGMHHSSYLYAKLWLIDISPFAVSVGGRKRVTWNKDNLEFEQDPLTDEKNNSRNINSLFLAASSKVEKIGLLANLYLDNQKVGLGGKFLLTDEIKLFVDAYQNYYENPLVETWSTAGVQFYNLNGSIATLRWETETDQYHLGFGVSF